MRAQNELESLPGFPYYEDTMVRASQQYRYITRLAKIRGGCPLVEGTRTGVHDVVGLLQNGESVDSVISNCFPEITRAQVYECLAY